MDFRHLIVTCLFSMLRLSFETQKIKENYAILKKKDADVMTSQYTGQTGSVLMGEALSPYTSRVH